MKKHLAITLLFALATTLANAQNDYNYSFYPTPKYARETRVQVPDSTTQVVSWKRDSTGNGLALFVQKNGAEITISNLFNLTNMVYNEKIKYIGVDAHGSIIYEAVNQTKEKIFVNPLLGFVAINFAICENSKFAKKKEDCDCVVHLFGNAPNIYKP